MDTYNYWAWIDDEYRTCRKRQVCDECGGIIVKGERYKRIAGVTTERKFEAYCFCPVCDTLHTSFVGEDGEGVCITELCNALWELDEDDPRRFIWNQNIKAREGCKQTLLLTPQDS